MDCCCDNNNKNNDWNFYYEAGPGCHIGRRYYCPQQQEQQKQNDNDVVTTKRNLHTTKTRNNNSDKIHNNHKESNSSSSNSSSRSGHTEYTQQQQPWQIIWEDIDPLDYLETPTSDDDDNDDNDNNNNNDDDNGGGGVCTKDMNMEQRINDFPDLAFDYYYHTDDDNNNNGGGSSSSFSDVEDDDDDHPSENPTVDIDRDGDHGDSDGWFRLTLCNIRSKDTIIAYVTVYDIVLYNLQQQQHHHNQNVPLQQGQTTTTISEEEKFDYSVGTSSDGSSDNNNVMTRCCTTLIVLCPPCTLAHLVKFRIEPTTTTQTSITTLLDQIKIDSDVQVWKQHPNPFDTHTRSIGFPLRKATTTTLAGEGKTLTMNSHQNELLYQKQQQQQCYNQDTGDRNGYLQVDQLNQNNVNHDENTCNGIDCSDQIIASLSVFESSHSDVFVDNNNNNNNNKIIEEDTTTLQQSSSFLCTQGVNGQLTHFFSGNLHAIDFRCPIGTLLVAVGNGIIVDVQIITHHHDHDDNEQQQQQQHVSGIGVKNLFQWNSIMIQLDEQEHLEKEANKEPTTTTTTTIVKKGGPLYVEYVHIQSSFVQVGERVYEGQPIGTSGNIGFSPEPHLHVAAYRSSEPDAPTCQVYFHPTRTITNNNNNNNTTTTNTSSLYIPVAGQWYNCNGPVPAPE